MNLSIVCATFVSETDKSVIVCLMQLTPLLRFQDNVTNVFKINDIQTFMIAIMCTAFFTEK